MAANITTQHTLAITPSARDDIVSALLSDYGNSFEPDDPSPSLHSPAPATKELPPPPPPPRSDSIARKPLPASERMDAKFQLRDDQDALVSPTSSVEGSPQPRKRIVSRSLSRGSKPASLKLTISNGSTASIPSPPGVSVSSQSIASPDSAVKDLPPPPPPKSERRANEREDMGSKTSKQARELARNDSLLSQGKSTDATSSPIVKRKAVPDSGAKSFKSLAELGNGPRGRRPAPAAPTSAPRTENVQVQTNIKPRENLRDTQAQLPPTPDEEKDEPGTLAQPKKVFGLPSNPRVNSLGSPVNVRSNAGLSVLKAQRPAPPIPTMDIRPTTPEPTPSPTLKPIMARRDCEISPVSPLPPPSNPRSSSVYESSPIEAEPQQQPPPSAQQVISATANPALPYAPTPPINAPPPARITSLEFPARTDSRPMSAPSRPTSMSMEASNLSPFPGPSVPSSPVAEESSGSGPQITIESDEPVEPATPPPFVPLTQQSIPLPLSLIPQITNKHLHCYTGHAQNIWSNNVFQPMGCMVCHDNGKERKWSCTWCQLRICKGCSDELMVLPGKNLAVLMEKKAAGVNREMEKIEEEDGGNMDVAVYNGENNM